jgi:hypothetical protein
MWIPIEKQLNISIDHPIMSLSIIHFHLCVFFSFFLFFGKLKQIIYSTKLALGIIGIISVLFNFPADDSNYH